MKPVKRQRDPVRDPIQTVRAGHPAFALWMEREQMRSPAFFQRYLAHRVSLRLRRSQIAEILNRPAVIARSRAAAGDD